jgi:hypothetical protein
MLCFVGAVSARGGNVMTARMLGIVLFPTSGRVEEQTTVRTRLPLSSRLKDVGG